MKKHDLMTFISLISMVSLNMMRQAMLLRLKVSIEGLESFQKEQLENFREILLEEIPQVEIRGI